MAENKVLSVIIPVASKRADIFRALNSLVLIKESIIEIIIIEMSEVKNNYDASEVIDLLRVVSVKHSLPASEARNLGASMALGKYLLFIDDDAELLMENNSEANLIEAIKSYYHVIILNRGHIKGGVFISHWPKKSDKITYSNFSRLAIEWNLIIERALFNKIDGFPSIGTGQHHSAQSGEAFVLVAKLLFSGKRIKLLPDIRIAHPNLDCPNKPLNKNIGYSYGCGYAIGMSMHLFPIIWQVYWLLRGIIAPIADISSKKYDHLDRYGKIILKCKLALVRILGLFDALLNRSPKTLFWLEEMAKRH